MQYYYWPALISFALSLYVAIHVLLNKTDSRAAFGWISVVMLLPILGSLLYLLFGFNRVQQRAREYDISVETNNENYTLDVHKSPDADYLNLKRVSRIITNQPLLGGNTAQMLISGHEAYPSMLAAIKGAKKYIYLSVYIFKGDELGMKFIDALAAASRRHVEVCVLLDGVGKYYSWIKAGNLLTRHGVLVKQFLPPRLFPFNIHINLRNHRKLLIIDDQVCYVGAMNINRN